MGNQSARTVSHPMGPEIHPTSAYRKSRTDGQQMLMLAVHKQESACSETVCKEVANSWSCEYSTTSVWYCCIYQGRMIWQIGFPGGLRKSMNSLSNSLCGQTPVQQVGSSPLLFATRTNSVSPAVLLMRDSKGALTDAFL